MAFQKGYTPWIKGKHHTKATCLKIRRAKIGEKNPNWKGDKALPQAGYLRANRTLFRGHKPCKYCGKIGEKHHKDSNPLNNNPKNVMWICRRCHMKHDGRMNRRDSLGRFKKCD